VKLGEESRIGKWAFHSNHAEFRSATRQMRISRMSAGSYAGGDVSVRESKSTTQGSAEEEALTLFFVRTAPRREFQPAYMGWSDAGSLEQRAGGSSTICDFGSVQEGKI
jgi:hypothetical protein